MSHRRTNGGSSDAVVEGGPPFAEGTFKVCRKARYQDGHRRGETAIVKQFKQGSPFEERYFQEELNIVREAERIVAAFNETGVLGRRRVRVNIPNIARAYKSGVNYLIEPFIEGFQKFNSNTGWADTSSQAAQAMQALSHFSYHFSKREFLLCDVQGGIYPEEIILTDPVIMSRGGERGPGDLGREGIYNFFEKHQCNSFCRSSWRNPRRYEGRYVSPLKNTFYGYGL